MSNSKKLLQIKINAISDSDGLLVSEDLDVLKKKITRYCKRLLGHGDFTVAFTSKNVNK
jgi:hypothetical protein